MNPRVQTMLAIALAAILGLFGASILVFGASFASPFVAAGAVAGAVVAGAMMVSPRLAFLLTAFVIPIERLGRFSDDSALALISLMRIVGTIALASTLWHAASKRWRLHFDPAVLLYTGFVVITFASYLWAIDPAAARGHAFTVLGNLVFFFLVVNVVRDWKLAREAVLVWLFASVLIGVYQIYDWHFGFSIDAGDLGNTANRYSTTWRSISEASLGYVRRATGTTSNAAVYGINLILTLPFLAWLYRTTRNPGGKLLILGSALVLIYNIFLTNTRGVMLFAGVAVILILLRRLVAITPPRFFLGVVGVGAVLWLLPDAIWKRALDPANYSTEQSGNLRARFHTWKAALTILDDHWLAGVGPGNWEIISENIESDEYGDGPVTAHNEFLQSFVDVGIFGWLFHWSFVALVLVNSIRAARRFARGPPDPERMWFCVACQIATITVLLFGLHVDVFHFPLKGWWLVAGLSCVLVRLPAEPAEARVRTAGAAPLPASAAG